MNSKTSAQQHTGYQTPPQTIKDLVEAPPTAGVSISPNKKWMLLLGRSSMPSIEEVAQKELRLAGIRINPLTNGASRSSYFTSLTLKSLATGEEFEIKGLPENPRIKNFSWSPDGSKIAFTITKQQGIELWSGDMNLREVTQQTAAIINDAMAGKPYSWLSDSQTLIYKTIVTNRGNKPEPPLRPSGPTIQENDGVTAAVRTYQDLLQNDFDEQLFTYYTTAQLVLLNLSTGNKKELGEPNIYRGISISPDGTYILVSFITTPFSYLVPYHRFPLNVEIWDLEGDLVKTVAQIPVAEAIPKGFDAVREGRRLFTWRAEKPATLYWVEAQDGGDPKKEVAVRDQLYYLEAPFSAEPTASLTTSLRYNGILWCNDEIAMLAERWWTSRRVILRTFSPNGSTEKSDVLFDRSYEDRYSSPGNFCMTYNAYGRTVLMTDDAKTFYLMGQGASPEGNRPFVDEFDLPTKKATRLWRSEAPNYETPIGFIGENEIITRQESIKNPPNYFVRNLKNEILRQITTFPNPYTLLEGVQKELIKYTRADGIELTGTLYLPKGFEKGKDKPLPVLMWAYPKEYKSKSAAGQVKDSPYQFIRIGAHSPIFWVTQGYAVFDDFGMPIIGEGDEEPNETFKKQLVAGAEAAVNQLVEMGVADKDKIAIGGHSYGAFMTANLLAHSDLFAAGIARSGAYNRTLTPFGFQWEQRTYWEAPTTYNNMSPFMHVPKIKAPILLIHGDADNNSGTYPMQSKRFYNALKGHGATARLVMLPHESHGYQAKESVLHMLWEMHEWLEKYVAKR